MPLVLIEAVWIVSGFCLGFLPGEVS